MGKVKVPKPGLVVHEVLIILIQRGALALIQLEHLGQQMSFVDTDVLS